MKVTREKIRKEEGITLVALVVTIIVLLILSMISIGTLMGENGILSMANRAKSDTEEAANDEAMKLKQMELLAKQIPDIGDIDDIDDINAEIDGLPKRKTLAELPGYIPIYTPDQFQKIASGESNYAISDLSGKLIGNYNMTADAKYALMEDLDFHSKSGVQPIKGFRGELEGNGCYVKNVTISNLSEEKNYTNIITGEPNYSPVGLFECVTDGTIKNMAITNSKFESYESIGAIAGQGDNITVENCYVKDTYFNKKKFPDEKVLVSGNIAGIVGTVGNKGCNINKCKTISIKRSGSNATGIVFMSFGPANIKDCQVINAAGNTLEEEYLMDGIIHCANNKLELDGCRIQDIKYENGYNSSGMVGVIASEEDSKILNCTAKRIEYESMLGAGIIFDSKSKNLTIDNCKVQDLKSKGNLAGICEVCGEYDTYVGNLKIANCTAKGINSENEISGILRSAKADNIIIDNCRVQNLKSQKDLSGIGNACFAKENIDISNCTAKELESIKSNINGIVKYSTSNNTTIDNCKTQKLCNYYGDIYGIACNNRGSEKIKITNSTVKDVNSEAECKFVGILNYTSTHIALVENCDIEGINTPNATFSGIIDAHGGDDTIKISNCTTKNVNISCFNAGIVNYSSANHTDIEDCLVESVKVIGKYNYCFGGIANNINFSNSTDRTCKIDGCIVKDITISGEDTNTNLYGGGIANFIKAENTTIQNCVVENVNTVSVGKFGGILAIYQSDNYGKKDDKLNINNCSVKNLNLSTAIGAQIGGIASTAKAKYITIENCGVEQVNLTKLQYDPIRPIYFSGILNNSNLLNEQNQKAGENIEINKCTVSDINVDKTNKSGGCTGITGYTNYKNMKIDQCEVENFNVENYGYTMGVISGISEDDNLAIVNSTVKEANINSLNYGSVGGIIGHARNSTMELSKNTVENVKMSTMSSSSNFGGLIASTDRTATINQCKVNNVTFDGGNNVGGIIGNTSNLYVSDCEIKDIEIVNMNGNIGGIVGVVDTAELSNNKIINLTIGKEGQVKPCYNVGGIVGKIGKGNVTNCNVDNLKLNIYQGSSSIGGIIGLSDSAPISNCNVKNSNLKIMAADATSTSSGSHLGGIAGLTINVQDCTVENTQIDSSEIPSYGTGGIIGHSSNYQDSLIQNCKITKCEIKGKESVGGICGAVARNITECTVEDTNINATGKHAGGIQGYGGYNSKTDRPITMENCKVLNCKIKGSQWVDYIQGRNSHMTDSDTDLVTNDKFTNCTYDQNTTKN